MKYSGKPAIVAVDIKEYVRLKHRDINNTAWAFVDGFCFAVLCYCAYYAYIVW